MKMSAQKRAIDKIYKRRDRYEIPDWQRTKVWSRPKKQRLIDSILKNWKLPKFYFLRTSKEPEEFEVVDGQQRLQAIFEFFDNELPLSKESQAAFGGEYYRELSDELTDRFDDFEIEYDQIEEAADEELKEFFQRLQEGLPLNASEKLNAVHSNLRDFVKELAEHPFLKNKTAVSAHRYGHFDIVAKVAAIEVEGTTSGLRFEDIKEVFEAHKSFSPASAAAKRIRGTFAALDAIFPTKQPLLRNRTIVQSCATLVARLVESGGLKGNDQKLRRFFEGFLTELAVQVELGPDATDLDYVKFQRTVNANIKAGPQMRQEVLLRKLLAYDPSFADALSATSVAQAGFSTRSIEIGDTLGILVSQVNVEYAGKHGEDLIKMTNKSAQALRRIGKTVTDLAAYETFIDDLYFLFHEGVGKRLEEKKPEVFKDLNGLRTELRHDVDHGKKSKVASKRKKLAEIFQRYAGATSPSTLLPERFTMVQVAILTDLEKAMRQLVLDVRSGKVGAPSAEAEA